MNSPEIWTCPICQSALARFDGRYQCVNRHQYDIARQGYVNLLPVNKKKSKQPGDSSEMILARSAFLAAGYYDFLLDKLIELFGSDVGQNILDIGCGEGFYLRQAAKALRHRDNHYWGVDISKLAARQAASKDKAAQFAVASCFSIPVASGSIDIALNVFSPCKSSEVERILRPEGRLIRVSPGPRHLIQLKQMLYTEATLHDSPKPLQGGEVISQIRLDKNVELGGHELRHLLGMTPFFWQSSVAARERALARNVVSMDFEFVIQEVVFHG